MINMINHDQHYQPWLQPLGGLYQLKNKLLARDLVAPARPPTSYCCILAAALDRGPFAPGSKDYNQSRVDVLFVYLAPGSNLMILEPYGSNL